MERVARESEVTEEMIEVTTSKCPGWLRGSVLAGCGLGCGSMVVLRCRHDLEVSRVDAELVAAVHYDFVFCRNRPHKRAAPSARRTGLAYASPSAIRDPEVQGGEP